MFKAKPKKYKKKWARALQKLSSGEVQLEDSKENEETLQGQYYAHVVGEKFLDKIQEQDDPDELNRSSDSRDSSSVLRGLNRKRKKVRLASTIYREHKSEQPVGENIQPLCYGDVITLSIFHPLLRCEFIVNDSVLDQVYCRKGESHKKVDIRKLFRIIPSSTVSSQEEIRQLASEENISETDRSNAGQRLEELVERLENEQEENSEVYKSLIGEPIQYKYKVQFVHEATKKFLCVSKSKTIQEIKNKKLEVYIMELSSYSSSATHFQILPTSLYQMKGKKEVLEDHSFSLMAEDPSNPFNSLYCTLSLSENFQDSLQDFPLLFRREKEAAVLKAKLNYRYSTIKEMSLPKKPVRIENANEDHYLRSPPESKEVNFVIGKPDWSGLWLIEPADGIGQHLNAETNQFYFRHYITKEFLNVLDGKLVVGAVPTKFAIKYMKSEHMSKRFIKIQWIDGNKYIQLSEKGHNNSHEAIVDSIRITHDRDLFEYKFISEDERLEASFCTDCHKKIKKLLNPGFRPDDMALMDITKAISGMQSYTNNNLDGKIHPKHQVGLPVKYRQVILQQIGMLKNLIKILKQAKLEVLEGKVSKEDMSLGKMILKLIGVAITSNRENKIIAFQNIQDLRDLMLHFGESEILVNIMEEIRLGDTDLEKSQESISDEFNDLIDWTLHKLKTVIDSNLLTLLRKVIAWRQDYNKFFQDKLLEKFCINDEINDQYLANLTFIKEEGKCTMEAHFKDASSENSEYIREEMLLLASLASGRNEEGIRFLRKKFQFDDIMQALNNEKTHNFVKSGLLRILDHGYINCPENNNYIHTKCYRFDDLKTNFPPKVESKLDSDQVRQVWEMIKWNLSELDMENNEYLVYDTLRLANDFLKYNLIWFLEEKPIRAFIYLIFQLLSKIYIEWKDYHSVANLREKKIEVEEGETYNMAFKISLSETVSNINNYVQEVILLSRANISVLRKIDFLICEILLAVSTLRNETLLLNAVQFFKEMARGNPLQDVFTRNVERRKATLFPGPNFIKRFPDLIDSLENYYEDYLKSMDSSKQQIISSNKGDDKINLMDHLVMLFNRISPSVTASRYTVLASLMAGLKERVMLMRGLNVLVVLGNQRDEKLFNEVKDLLYLELKPRLRLFTQNFFCNRSSDEKMQKSINDNLRALLDKFGWKRDGTRVVNKMMQDIFRNIHGHNILIDFLKKNQGLIVDSHKKIQYFNSSDYPEKDKEMFEQVNEMFDHICDILCAFCIGSKINKNELWNSKSLLLFPTIPISETNKELDLVLEIVKDNMKIVQSFVFESFIKSLKTKAEGLFNCSDISSKRSALIIIKIFLEILEYEKLFPEAEWFQKLYKRTFEKLDFEETVSVDITEIQVLLLEYLARNINDTGFEFINELVRDYFLPEKFIPILEIVCNNVHSNAHVSQWDSLLEKVNSSVITIYKKIYFSGTSEYRSNISENIRQMLTMLGEANYQNLYKIYTSGALTTIWENFKNGLRNELLAVQAESLLIDEAIDIENCRKEIESNMYKNIEEERKEMTEESREDVLPHLASYFKSSTVLDELGNEEYIGEEIAKLWDRFVEELILSKKNNRDFIFEEQEHAMEQIRSKFERYLKKDISFLTFSYMEFFKKILELFSTPEVFSHSILHIYNLQILLQIFILMLRYYEKAVTDQKVTCEFHDQVTTKFIQMGALRMIFQLLASLRGPQQTITESLLLSFAKHLMYAEGNAGQEALFKIMSESKDTEIIFSRITKVLDFFLTSITEYKIYHTTALASYLSKYAYRPKLDLVKNIFDFLTIAADNEYTDFQNYLRHQDNVRISHNLVRITMFFLKQTLPTLKQLNMLHVAVQPLRAIVEFIQGPNIDNMKVIVANEIFQIAAIIYGDLEIQQLTPSSSRNQIRPEEDPVLPNNFAMMRLKYFLTEILEDFLTKSKYSSEIFAKFRSAITEEIIIKNLYDYYYIFFVEQQLHFSRDLLYRFVHREITDGCLVVEFGFELSFLVRMLQEIPEFKEEEDYDELFKLVDESKNKKEKIMARIKHYCMRVFTLSFCRNVAINMGAHIYQNRLNEEIQKEKVIELFSHIFNRYTGQVEINMDGQLQTIYFPKNVESFEENQMKLFKESVDRTSHKTRTEGIMQWAPKILHTVQTEHNIQQALNSIVILRFINLSVNNIKFLSILLAIFMNVMILITDTIDDNIHDMANISYSDYPMYIVVSGILMVILDGIVFFDTAIHRIPFDFTEASDPNWTTLKQVKSEKATAKIIFSFFYLLCTDISLLYYTSTLAMAILGICYHPFFFCYQLSLIFVRSWTMQNLLRAIFGPINQIVMTLVILIIAVYYFSIFAYKSFSDDYPNNTCDTLLNCFAIAFDQTFKIDGGLSSYMDSTYGSTDGNVQIGRFLFDNIYSFIIITLITEMISGIIVDKFGAMRKEEDSLNSDFEKECFICGKSRAILETESIEGYKRHITTKHYLWNYFFFIAYLQEKPEYELNNAENFVRRKIECSGCDWFPGYKDDKDDKDEKDDKN